MEEGVLEEIRELFAEQKVGVLATEYEGQPYASLLAFAATEDLRTIVFGTDRSTRKYSNLMANPNASMLVDDRENEFYETVAVTAMGKAKEATAEERKQLFKAYVAKHPELEGFLLEPSTALIKMTVESYIFVEGFRSATVVDMRPPRLGK